MDKKKKKIIISIIAVIVLLLLIIGITYAYWLVRVQQTNKNVISARCLNISLTNEENEITLSNQYPLSDEDGMKLTPYTFTIKNECEEEVDYQINLEAITIDDKEEISSEALKAVIDTGVPYLFSEYSTTDTTVEGAYESRVIANGSLGNKESKSHELRIWIDGDAAVSEMNKSFKSKITVTAGSEVDQVFITQALNAAIFRAYNKDSVETLAVSDFVNTGTTTEDAGLYKYEDYYYFRGNPTDNYVQFGTTGTVVKGQGSANNSSWYKFYSSMSDCTSSSDYQYNCTYLHKAGEEPLYWRILRVNEDGSVRLIFDGTTLAENNVEHEAFIEKEHTVSSVGSDVAVDYTSTNMKTQLNKWYELHLNGKSNYLADSTICNDLEIKNTTYWYSDAYGTDSSYHVVNSLADVPTTHPMGDSYSYDSGYFTEYAAYDRILGGNISLNCNRDEDVLTVANGKLTYPIGIMTADEAIFAGGAMSNNTNHFLYTGYSYSLNTPGRAEEYSDAIDQEGNSTILYNTEYFWYVYENGGVWESSYNYDSRPVRPVITLKPGVLVEGNGTVDSPYVVK